MYNQPEGGFNQTIDLNEKNVSRLVVFLCMWNTSEYFMPRPGVQCGK
jgi:hypothetical protein